MTLKYEVGNRYGLLFVVGRQHRPDTNRAYWYCECDCGNLHVVLGDHLRTGAIQSCGCLRPKARPPLRPRKIKRKQLAWMREYTGDINKWEVPTQHVYRKPRKLEMGPIVEAAKAALEARS